MKAVVVRVPWAPLIVQGLKAWETRTGPPAGALCPKGVRPTPGYGLERGERIAIVAGKSKPDVSETGWAPWEPLMDPDRPGVLREPLVLGAVIGTVAVADALPIVERAAPIDQPHPDLGWEPHFGWEDGELHVLRLWAGSGWLCDAASDVAPLGDFTPSRWAWWLHNARQCQPVPCTGQRGVFMLPDDVANAIHEA